MTTADAPSTPPESPDEPRDVVAETIIHVSDGSFSGEVEFCIPHLVHGPDPESGERIVYFNFPDAESVSPATAAKVPVAFRVSELDGIIAAMQAALARARAIPILPLDVW